MLVVCKQTICTLSQFSMLSAPKYPGLFVSKSVELLVFCENSISFFRILYSSSWTVKLNHVQWRLKFSKLFCHSHFPSHVAVILSSCTHPHAIPNLYDLLSFAQHESVDSIDFYCILKIFICVSQKKVISLE